MLTQLCDDAGLNLPTKLATIDLLTPYGVAGRYGSRSPGTVDRATATQLAADAVAWARAIIDSRIS